MRRTEALALGGVLAALCASVPLLRAALGWSGSPGESVAHAAPAVGPGLDGAHGELGAELPEPFGGLLRGPDGGSAAAASWTEPYFPFLDDESPDQSVSVGDTSWGWVVNARRAVESDALGILPEHKTRDLAYGTAELVALLEYAARTLHAQTGTRLWIGNIGRRGGGDIPWSVSHNAGRDADIALCYLDARGQPVDPPGLVPLDARGVAKTGGLRFDAARTWTVVKALLEGPGAQVQFLFLSAPLKKQLLEHARRKKESPLLVARADAVVKQPAGALPHDDHLHLRIYCGRRDVEGGCVDTGVVHPWVRLETPAREARIRIASAELDDAVPGERKRAVERLALLGARAHADAIAARLDDDAAEVREAAALAIGSLGEERHARPLVARFGRERKVAVRAAILRALPQVGGAVAGGFLAQLVADTSREPARDEAVAQAEAPILFTPASLVASDPALFAASLEATLDRPIAALDAPGVAGGPVCSMWSDEALEATPEEVAALRRAAVEAAGVADRLEPVDALLALLRSDDVALRARAAEALARVTNRSFGTGWDDPSLAEAQRDAAIRAWRAWVEGLRRTRRDAWVAQGFLAAGYRVPRLDKTSLWELVRAAARDDHLGYNARRLIARIVAHDPPRAEASGKEACRYWLRWVGNRRKPLGLPVAPPNVERACW